MPTTQGPLDPPLGNARLQVARLLSSLLNTNTHSLNVVIESLGTLNVLLVRLLKGCVRNGRFGQQTVSVQPAGCFGILFLQELFFKYVWSNFLHTQVEVCIATVLGGAPNDVDGNSETPLLNQVS